jgi:hypothetical protein
VEWSQHKQEVKSNRRSMSNVRVGSSAIDVSRPQSLNFHHHLYVHFDGPSSSYGSPLQRSRLFVPSHVRSLNSFRSFRCISSFFDDLTIFTLHNVGMTQVLWYAKVWNICNRVRSL